MPNHPRVFISYARKDGEEIATALRRRLELEEPEITLWQDRARLEGGVGWWKQIEAALDKVQFLVIVMTPAAIESETTRKEWKHARQQGVCVYPIKGVSDSQLDYGSLPNWMQKSHFFDLAREWETFTNYLKSPCNATRVPFMAPDRRPGYVQRPKEFGKVLSLLLDKVRANPVAATVSLHGPGGSGKTTLAAAVCHDDDIIAAFDDGILWTTLGQNPNVHVELTKLFTALTGERVSFADVEEASRSLCEKLENKNCLVVIDDVWNRAHLKPFLRGATHCARLVTTRRLDVGIDTERVAVGGMTTSEAVQMLRIGVEAGPSEVLELKELAARLGKWPLILRLANSTLCLRADRGDSVQSALRYVNRALDKKSVTAFDPADAIERSDAVGLTLAASLNLLSGEERERLTELAILPEDVEVPLTVVMQLWAMEEFEAEQLIAKLDMSSLLEFNLKAGTVKLHDVTQTFLYREIASVERLHARLVDAWGDLFRLRSAYTWRWLTYHLWNAARLEDLRRLLLSFEWMQAKLEHTDVSLLVADYDYMANDDAIQLLQSALRLAAHVLARDKTQLLSQLLARLSTQEHGLGDMLQRAANAAAGPWLRPLKPSLARPGEPLLRTLVGHAAWVGAVAVTPDGERAVSGSGDETLRLWDLNTGKELCTFTGRSGWCGAVAITPDGKYAVSGSADQMLKLWDLDSGDEMRSFEGHTAWVGAVAVTPDGKRAISGARDCTLRLWDLDSGKQLRVFEGHDGWVGAVAVTPDGDHAVSGSRDHRVKLWDVRTGEAVRTFEGHGDAVWAVAVTPDGRQLVSGSDDRTIKLWDLKTGATLHTFEGHTDWVGALAVTADGKYLVSGSDDRTLKLWDLQTRQVLYTFTGHSDAVWTVDVTPDATRVISGSYDRTLKLWDLNNAKRLGIPTKNGGRIAALIITADGKHVICASENQPLTLWDVASGQALKTFKSNALAIQALALTADGQRIISGSSDGKLQIWDFESGDQLSAFLAHGEAVQCVAVTPDSKYCISASDDRTLKIWDMESGEAVRTLIGHAGRVTAAAVTADGAHIVSGARDQTLKLWDLASGKEVRSLYGHGDLIGAIAIVDATRVVSGSDDRALKLWDLETGNELRTYNGHTDEVRSVAVTTNRKYLLSGSADQTLRLWDLERGNIIASFWADADLCACALAPDGSTVVAGDVSGRMHFLRIQDSALR